MYHVVGRFSGHVVGFDMHGTEQVWKVRVQKPGQKIDGKKVTVHSVAEGTVLSRGMDVDFQLGQFRRGREMVLKAVDVRPRIDNPEVGKVAVKCDHCDEPAELMFEAQLVDSESAEYARTCLPHLQHTIRLLQTSFQSQPKVLRVMNVFKGDKNWRPMDA